MDYKDTLHLPQTDFEMRGNLVSKQDKFVNLWQTMNLYYKMLEVNQDRPAFVLHDGPPYANGHIHIGHALNKILKDFIVRSRHKLGYKVHYRPGWDTHGLPIENQVTKNGVNRKEVPINQFREYCHQYALEQVAQQKQDFINLGTVGAYDNPYITLKPEYEAEQVRIFAKMCMRGMIYKGLKPVYWSPSSESALAEAEIEYHDKKDPSIYVRFKVVDSQGLLPEDSYFVIWTTTPWTIPANLAISVHPDFEYALVKTTKGNLIVLNELVEQLMSLFELNDYQVINKYKGSQFERFTAKHPLYDRLSLILCGEHVTSDSGTGCVHTAPGFGMDDYIIGLKYGLEPYCNVDERGCFKEDSGEWLFGKTTDEGNKLVSVKLDEQGDLLKLVFITHSYPHDWRTKQPIIFRATDQWFASIDLIRDQVLDMIDNDINWKPSWGQTRMHRMIADRNDWCISRQRAWGLPIPIIYAQDKTPIMDEVVFEHIAQLFEKHGSNIWYQLDAKDLLPANYTHPGSPDNIFTKEKDILDVWFDSGVSHTAALKSQGISLPVDLYLEGSDQYRGWFNSSLIIGAGAFNVSPYKQVVSHGFIVDEKGEKLSKSKGAALTPDKICQRLGTDTLRLWVASVDYTSDIGISEALLKQVTETYRKIRNTLRFLHGNVTDLDKRVDIDTLPLVDKHVLYLVNQTLKECKEAYLNYDFSSITSKVSKLMINTLSAYYLDFTKDILYILKKDSLRRRQVQTVLDIALEGLLHILTPIIPFTCEELYQLMGNNENSSVQLGLFIDDLNVVISEEDLNMMNRLMELRSDVFKALEVAREQKIIGTSLKAELKLAINQQLISDIESVFEDLNQFAQWLIVSKVTLESGDKIEVLVAQGHTCQRCWNVVAEVDENGLCPRCNEVMYGKN